jgi:hypothetical protein
MQIVSLPKTATLLLGLLGAAYATAQQPAGQQSDRMAEIGTKASAVRLHLLYTPQPPPLPDKHLPVNHQPKAAFRPMNRLDTPEELGRELSTMREKHQPFLQDLAPNLAPERLGQELTAFSWRQETEEDRRNFTGVLSGKAPGRRCSCRTTARRWERPLRTTAPLSR